MNSTSSISQTVTVGVDVVSLCSDNSGQKTVYFNLSRIFQKLHSFKFESRLEIRCGKAFYCQITQTGNENYDLVKTILTIEELKNIVESFFDDTVNAYQLHRNYEGEADGKSPQILLPDHLLETYFASPNFLDLVKSCCA